VDTPVSGLGEVGTLRLEFVLDEKGHHLGKSHGFFLGIGEAGNVLALHQGLALRRPYMTERARRVTNEGDGLVGSQESLNQLDRVLVLGQVPHRAMTAWIEDGIEILWLDAVEADCRGKLRLCCGIGLEPMREFGLEVRLVALRIERRLAALRRGEHDLGTSVLEMVIRRGEFLQPEARLAPCVSELVVGGKNYQDLHSSLLSLRSPRRMPKY